MYVAGLFTSRSLQFVFEALTVCHWSTDSLIFHSFRLCFLLISCSSFCFPPTVVRRSVFLHQLSAILSFISCPSFLSSFISCPSFFSFFFNCMSFLILHQLSVILIIIWPSFFSFFNCPPHSFSILNSPSFFFPSSIFRPSFSFHLCFSRRASSGVSPPRMLSCVSWQCDGLFLRVADKTKK